MRHLILFFAMLSFPFHSHTQSPAYGILPINQSVKKIIAKEACTIQDIHPGYPASWVKTYVRLDLALTHHDEIKYAIGDGFNLSPAQKRLLQQGETGDDIVMTITYYPNNNLSKEQKEMQFTMRIVPDHDAEFQGGREAMQQYLKEKAIDQLAGLTDIPQVRIRFSVDPDGIVHQAYLLQPARQKEVDAILLNSISEMPRWIPATNADGRASWQEFEFIVTNDLCAYNTLMQ